VRHSGHATDPCGASSPSPRPRWRRTSRWRSSRSRPPGRIRRDRWIGGSVDPILFIWYLRWLPFALAHGHDPLISTYLQVPDGFNLLWNTSILLPAFVLSPVTLLFGAVVSYNLLATLALALSAWCAYLAFRRYVRPEAAASGGSSTASAP
jgi:hypothetical protein